MRIFLNTREGREKRREAENWKTSPLQIFFISLIFISLSAVSVESTLEGVPITDIFKQEIVLEKSPFPLRLFLFFTKKQQKIFEQTKQAILDKIYKDPNIEIYLTLQKKKFSTLIRRKLLKELQNEFKQENNLRQVELKKNTPPKNILPGYFLLVDFDGKVSSKFGLAPIHEKPTAVFLDTEGKILAQFNSDQINECLEWLHNYINNMQTKPHN